MNERVPLSERGSGLVELALVLPVVLVLTLAIVQLGVLGFAASAADNAARQLQQDLPKQQPGPTAN